tara:strand:+ start:45 stop:620 length:576 start_codon:yes stop_codon:yes gene_type:complete
MGHCCDVQRPTLWELCLPEYRKYAEAVGNGGVVDPLKGGIKIFTQDAVRTALSEWRKAAVFKLHVIDRAAPPGGKPLSKELVGWRHECMESPTRPEFTLVDGFKAQVGATQLGPVYAEEVRAVRRFTRVWWRWSQAERNWTVFNPASTGEACIVSGGYVRSEYYSSDINASGFTRRCLWLEELGGVLNTHD